MLFRMCFGGEAFDPCLIGHVGKCLAESKDMTEYSVPDPKAIVINESIQSNPYICFNNCAENIACFMAAYKQENQKCTLYRNLSYMNIINRKYLLFLWKCCNINKNYPAPNRCPGFWKYKHNSKSFNNKRLNDPIVQIHNTNLYNCQMACLQNPICGSINVINYETGQLCELIIKFPVEDMKIEFQLSWTTYIWQCASNYTLPIPDTTCISREYYGTGYWIIEQRSIPMIVNLTTVLYFHTLNYEACLKNCMKYKHCQKAWYSLSSSFCMLEGSNRSECADIQALNNYNFTTYIWKKCSLLDHTSEKMNLGSIICHKIKDYKQLYIYKTKCGSIPNNVSLVYPCSTPIPELSSSYFPNFCCKNQQSFQILYKLNGSISQLGKYANLSWVRVFTGYESFWLANVSKVNFPSCFQSECQIYNASIQLDESFKLTILSRKQWFAKKSKRPESKYPSFPVPFVVITDTERPYCSCFSEEACSYQMRAIQDILFTLIDIPYNFIITGNGLVYKSRGWEFENQANGPEYNSKSMSIALCGRYFKEPNALQLNTIKSLIQLSIKHKKVDSNYTLYLLRDVGVHKLPSKGLSRVIVLWPHYRGYIKYDCSYNIYIIFYNFICYLFAVFILIVFYNTFISRLIHNEHCKTLSLCRIEIMYGKLFQQSREMLPKLFLNNFNDLTRENIFISPFTSSIYWIENKREIGDYFHKERQCQCQSDFISIFNLCRFQSNLININSLVIIPELRSCSKITVFMFERVSQLDNQVLLILHCNHLKSFTNFVNHLYKNQCLCISFKIMKYLPQSKLLLMSHTSFQEINTEFNKNIRRSDLENKYCYLYDDNYCTRFYGQY